MRDSTLMLSTPGSKWLVAIQIMLAASLALRASAAEITLDSSTRYQTIEGFGTCTYLVGDLDKKFYTTPEFQNWYMQDLGASMLRFELPPEAQPEPDLDLDNLNLDKLHMDNFRVSANGKLAAALEKCKLDKFTLLCSLWTPPAWMKDNNGNSHGSLRSDRRDHLGKYMAAFCLAFEKTYGVHIEAVSVQNELRFEEPYNSCTYTPEQFRLALDAIGPQFKKWNCTTRVMGPEDVGAGSNYAVLQEMKYIYAAQSDPVAAAALSFFNVHGYADDNTSSAGGDKNSWTTLRDDIQRYNKPLWQTETSGEKTTWPEALHVAADIHESLVYGNCSAWLYWQILDDANPNSVYGLGTSMDPAQKKICAAKHYFRYIRPGAVRIETKGQTDALWASAFVHDANQTLTTVLVNNGDKDESVTINLPEYPRGVTTLKAWRTSVTESFAALGDLAATGNKVTITMPAKSIVTLYGIGTDKSLTPKMAFPPTNLIALPGNGQVELSWTAAWNAKLPYQIERNEMADEKTVAAPTSFTANGTEFIDTTATNGKTYSYTVSAADKKPSSLPVTAMPNVAQALFTSRAPSTSDASQIESEWDKAPVYKVEHLTKSAEGNTPGTATFKLLWDAQNLYALVESTDATPTTVPNKPYDSDHTEIYLNGTNSAQAFNGPDDFQYVFGYGIAQAVEAKHGATTGVEFATVKTDTGYRTKIKIPLETVHVAGYAGNIIGLDVDLGQVAAKGPSKRAWWAATDVAWVNPSVIGAAQLVGAGTSPQGSPTELKAVGGNAQVALTWKPVDGATGYLISRALTQNGPYQVVAHALTPSYTDLGLKDQTTYFYNVSAYGTGGLATTFAQTSAATVLPQPITGAIYINAGGDAVGIFAADEFFSGGTKGIHLDPIDRAAPNPAPETVYSTERFGKMTYTIPGLKPGGSYLVRFHFVESYWTQADKRVFDVSINGADVIKGLDVFKQAGGNHKVLVQEFPATADKQGQLMLDFNPVVNVPEINALEVIPQESK